MQTIRESLKLSGILSNRRRLTQPYQSLHWVVISRTKTDKKSLDKGIPRRKLHGFICILKPDKCLSFHVKGSHSDTLIERGLVVIKELINLVCPVGLVLTTKPREIQPQGAGLDHYVPPSRILVFIVKLESPIVSMVPAFVVKCHTIIFVLATVITSIMFMDLAFITSKSKRKLIGRRICKRRHFRWWPSLSSQQCSEYLRNVS
jgi:hypothetical protein